MELMPTEGLHVDLSGIADAAESLGVEAGHSVHPG